MMLGCGAMLVALAMTAVALTGLIRRVPVAPALLVLGLVMSAYWYAAMAWDFWAPALLLGYWHFWGIAGFILTIGGAIGAAIHVVVRMISRQRPPAGDPCPVCGYDLRGTPGSECPECGPRKTRAA
jgi:hypothetical protein